MHHVDLARTAACSPATRPASRLNPNREPSRASVSSAGPGPSGIRTLDAAGGILRGLGTFAMAPRAAAPKTDAKPEAETKTKTQRPWNVIVHDDPITLMGYVTRVFMDVFGYAQAKAHKLMMEVHTAGRSVVWTGAREQAETYVMRLHGYHLLATLEQVGD